MHCTIQRRRLIGIFGAGILALTLLAGCGTMEVAAFRDIQTASSDLAARESFVSLSKAFSIKADTVPQDKAPADAAKLYEQYYDLLTSITALEEKASGTFRNDKLYGNVVALRLLILWRTTYYGHLSRIADAPPVTAVEEVTRDGKKLLPDLPLPAQPDLLPLTEVAGLAARSMTDLEKSGVPLYPRDQFLLEAMAPLIRYEIALIRWQQQRRKPAQKITTDEIQALVTQMAKAEEELAVLQAKSTSAAHLAPYSVLNRFVILTTAESLIDDGEPKIMNETTGKMEIVHAQEQYETLFPELVKRQQFFLDNAKKAVVAGGASPVEIFRQMNSESPLTDQEIKDKLSEELTLVKKPATSVTTNP